MTADDELAKLARVRAARQLLHRPRASHPADVLRVICGAQAQEPPAARLAIRAREPKLTAAEVESARTEERSTVRLWAMRNTAHLIATDDLPLVRSIFMPLMAAFNRRRLAQFGLDANAQERALSLIARQLERDGALTRTELSERLQASGIGVDTERRVHLFPLAVSTGLAALGPGEGRGTKLVLARDWLPEPPDLDRGAALAELARRYFAAFGPATEADFAGWAGLPLGEVRRGMAAIATGLREVTVLGQPAWQPRARAPRPVAPGLLRLLPAFDNYLMGHRARDFIAPRNRWPLIGPGGGALYPPIVVGGSAVGTWRLKRRAGGLRAELLPFEPLATQTANAVDAELADVARFEAVTAVDR
jgi:hypothetical protein